MAEFCPDVDHSEFERRLKAVVAVMLLELDGEKQRRIVEEHGETMAEAVPHTCRTDSHLHHNIGAGPAVLGRPLDVVPGSCQRRPSIAGAGGPRLREVSLDAACLRSFACSP
jgi:hypothetical protein